RAFPLRDLAIAARVCPERRQWPPRPMERSLPVKAAVRELAGAESLVPPYLHRCCEFLASQASSPESPQAAFRSSPARRSSRLRGRASPRTPTRLSDSPEARTE